MPDNEEITHHQGHRQRLRQRFLKAGPRSLADYELLEMLLFLAKPRGDVKPLAKSLLAQFGGFAEVISAEPNELLRVQGMGESSVAALKTAQAAALRLIGQPLMNKPVLSSWRKLLEYCRAGMGFEKIEHFRLLFLDKRNLLIADEMLQRGTIDHTAVYPREVVKRALEIGASAIIMVHNHPSGDPSPSDQDIETTKQVFAAVRPLGIILHDHVIIGGEDYFSFRSMGLLD